MSNLFMQPFMISSMWFDHHLWIPSTTHTVSMDIYYAKQFQIGNFTQEKEKNWIRLMMLDHDNLGKM